MRKSKARCCYSVLSYTEESGRQLHESFGVLAS